MTKTEKIFKEEKLIGYKITKQDEKPFTVPVIDVRRNEDQRRLAEYVIKQNNAQRGSRYFKPSYSILGYSYNVSRK